MKYRSRLVEKKLRTYFDSFPCVAIVGARQVGKSTLLQQLYGQTIKAFTFDPVQDLFGARADPDLFLRNNPPPLILDEIQYAPELVPALKRRVDQQRRPGQFLLTGSQQWEVMRRLAESLAGRVAILDLPGFALSERQGDPAMSWFGRWLEGASRDSSEQGRWLQAGSSAGLAPTEVLWRGAFPEVQELSAEVVPGWMRGYTATYLQRDVRSLLAVRDETQFAAFLGLCAAVTAQESNHSHMGRDLGLSTPTAQSWLAVLRGTFQWVEVPAFSRNALKRLSQKPKGYLADTGLACHLLRLGSPEALLGNPSYGALFETLVALDLMKQTQGLSSPPAFFHYRQHSGAEVDLVVEYNGRWFPVEIKAASRVGPRDATSIGVFQGAVGPAAAPGLIVYAGDTLQRLGDRCLAVPFDARIPAA